MVSDLYDQPRPTHLSFSHFSFYYYHIIRSIHHTLQCTFQVVPVLDFLRRLVLDYVRRGVLYASYIRLTCVLHPSYMCLRFSKTPRLTTVLGRGRGGYGRGRGGVIVLGGGR